MLVHFHGTNVDKRPRTASSRSRTTVISSEESTDDLDIITIDEGASSDDSFAMNEKRALSEHQSLVRDGSVDNQSDDGQGIRAFLAAEDRRSYDQRRGMDKRTRNARILERNEHMENLRQKLTPSQVMSMLAEKHKRRAMARMIKRDSSKIEGDPEIGRELMRTLTMTHFRSSSAARPKVHRKSNSASEPDELLGDDATETVAGRSVGGHGVFSTSVNNGPKISIEEAASAGAAVRVPYSPLTSGRKWSIQIPLARYRPSSSYGTRSRSLLFQKQKTTEPRQTDRPTLRRKKASEPRQTDRKALLREKRTQIQLGPRPEAAAARAARARARPLSGFRGVRWRRNLNVKAGAPVSVSRSQKAYLDHNSPKHRNKPAQPSLGNILY